MVNRRIYWFFSTLLALALAALAGCGERISEDSPSSAAQIADVNEEPTSSLVVYSSRNEHLIQPLFELYQQKTGVAIEYKTDKAGILIERIKAEGEYTPADILITVDAGTLGYAASQGIFQPLNSPMIDATVPPSYRDSEDRWTGLSLRARTVVYSTERVSPTQLTTYEALSEPQWKGKLCLRTSKKVYNQSLVAMLISEHGEQQTENIVSGWVSNLAVPPLSNDTKVMEAILVGRCDVGIVNSYYFGRMQQENPDIALRLFWPNQNVEGSGVHVNVAGAGILKYSKHPAAARRFIEWLVTGDAQAIFSGVNQEYPVNSSAKKSDLVNAWGNFVASPLPLSDAYILQPDAVRLMDRVGYK